VGTLRVGGAEIQRSEEMNLSCHPALIEGKCLLTIWHLGSPGRVRVFPQMAVSFLNGHNISWDFAIFNHKRIWHLKIRFTNLTNS
jgi:hypothetical protein